MRARGAWRSAVLAVALAVLVLGACQGGGGDDDDGSGAQPAPTTGPEPKAEASSTTTRAPARIVATADGEFPGVILELLGLRRTSPEIVTLDFALRNSAPESLSFGSDAFTEAGPAFVGRDFNSVSGVYLTDEVNRKKYLVQRDVEGNCLCSRDIETPDDPGDRMVYFAKFPAPPAEVRTLTVVVPHFTPVDGVGISE